MNHRSRSLFLFSAATVVSTLTVSAQSLLVPEFRDAPATFYSEWDVFASTTGAAPDVAGSLGTISELTGASFVTSSGNIYNLGVASAFTLDLAGAGPTGYVLLQIVTQGTELDLGSVSLDTGAGTLDPASTIALGSTPLGGFGGSAVGTAFTWDLSGLEVDDFTIAFAASGAHLSLDRVVLDGAASAPLAVIPEPSSAALWLGMGGLLAGLVRRRRRG